MLLKYIREQSKKLQLLQLASSLDKNWRDHVNLLIQVPLNLLKCTNCEICITSSIRK